MSTVENIGADVMMSTGDGAFYDDNGFIAACISSSVRPLVSGTSFATNRMVKPDITENRKNVPESCNRFSRHIP